MLPGSISRRLPTGRPIPIEEWAPADRAPSEPGSLPQGRSACDLMILDDMFLIRLAVAATAEEAGFSVCQAEDSTAALELLRRVPCRILLADVNLGQGSAERDGRQVAAQAMRLHPDLCVIYTSASPVELGRKLTARERVLQKPYPQERLIHMLQDLLRSTPATAPLTALAQHSGSA